MEVDPLTKIGIMLAIRQLARDDGAGVKPQDALEWALHRRILAPRPGVDLDMGKDDLVLTPHGQQVVARFWFLREQRRLAAGRGLVLRPTDRRVRA